MNQDTRGRDSHQQKELTIHEDTYKLLDDSGRFVIRDFSTKRPFSSFLPGIAGPLGVPMWVFYVNRGQAIASFGIENKNNPIMEFEPANKAYQNTPYTGFRTFLKLIRGEGTHSNRYGRINRSRQERCTPFPKLLPAVQYGVDGTGCWGRCRVVHQTEHRAERT